MANGNRTGRVLAIALGVVTGSGTAPTLAQTFERDTKVTGPRGRTLERQVDITRSPAGVERDITIHRPGGATFQRETFIPRGGGFGIPHGPRGPVFYGGGGGGGGGLSPLGAGLLGGALGTGAGMLLGSAIANSNNAALAQPPVIVTQPVIVGQPAPPVVEYVPPVRYQPALQPLAVVDPVGQQIARLQSNFEPSRREACQVLGRLGDARAVAPLVDRLKNDTWQDVRIAAATALGQIGDPAARIYLERSVIYDKRQAVRDASTTALARLPHLAPVVQQAGAFSSTPAPSATEIVPPPPTPASIPR